MSSTLAFRTDTDIRAEHSEYAGCCTEHDEKSQKAPKRPKSTVAAREGKECRMVTALRTWLSRPRINKASVRATAGGCLIATQPSLDVCLSDVFTSSRRRCQLSLKDKLLFDSSARAEEGFSSSCFTPRAEARFAFEQLHLDGDPVHKVLRFDFSMLIKHPYILDRSVIINVVPSQPGDFTINIKFLDHVVPRTASQAAPVFPVDRVQKRTQYDGDINLVPGARSGVTLSFCRGCDAFECDRAVGHDAETEACDTGGGKPWEPTPKYFNLMPEERMDWELFKYIALESRCSRTEGHSVPIAQCAIKVLYDKGRYWPRLEPLSN